MDGRQRQQWEGTEAANNNNAEMEWSPEGAEHRDRFCQFHSPDKYQFKIGISARAQNIHSK